MAIVAVSLWVSLSGGRVHADLSDEGKRPDPSSDDALVGVQVKEALDTARQQLESGETTETLPFADGSDWVRTTSGEWARGSIDWMREDVMSFDSDEFGELEINMREVAEVHAARTNTYLLDDRSRLIGFAMITTDKLAVQTEEGIVVRERDELWSIVEGGGPEIDYWSVVLDVGLGMNRGNSNQADLNLRFGLNREGKRTLAEVDYILNLGFADRELNVSRHVVPFTNRVWLTRIWFVEPIAGQLLSDRFQDIRFRAQPAATAGLRFLNIPSRALWDLSVGFGYEYLRLFDPLIGTRNPQHDGLARFQTRARFDFTPDVSFIFSWVTNLIFTTIGNTNHTGIAELLFEVTNVLNLQATFMYFRTEEPHPREDGTLPAKNDYFFTIGVSMRLG